MTHTTQNMNKATTLQAAGSPYKIWLPDSATDYIQGKIAKEGVPYELEMLSDMRTRVQQGDFVIDVGANIGNHTFYLAACGCDVLAFEPNPQLVAALHASIELNDWSARVSICDVGLGKESNTARFAEENRSNMGAMRLQTGAGELKIVTLDSLKLNRKPTLLKIDVEGMELDVLLGGERLITESRPLIYVECLDQNEFRSVFNWLSERGYIYWDTFNASPTHLFFPIEKTTADQRLARFQFKEVLEAYRTTGQLLHLRRQLDEANGKLNDANQKYRDACGQITTQKQRIAQEEAARTSVEVKLQQSAAELRQLQAQLDDANQKYRDACGQITTQKQRIVQEEVARAAAEGKLEQLSRLEIEYQSVRARLDDANKKFRDSTDQIASLKQEHAQLKHQLSIAEEKRSGHYAHLEAERKKNRSLAKQVELLEKDNQRLSNSLSLAVGTAIVKTKTVKDVFLLPSRLYAAIKKHKKKLLVKKLGPVQAPLQDKTIPSRQQVCEVAKAPHSDVVTPDLLALGWPLPDQNSKIRMMSVFDEFSRECFAPHANLIEPRPDNWLPLLNRDKPELLFVESTWRGNKSTWQYRVAKYANPPGRELSAMVAEFKARKLPTVFWNKEDPVHFDNFISAAEEFDYIFTTAEEAVPRYAQHSKAKINVLPFAAEAGLHNPIGSGRRNNKVCFAGSYYANRFSERRDDQLMLLDAASHFDLDIYDRNAGANASKDFCFPERFDRFIRGKLPYDEMSKAYRNYRVFLNVNSVIDSKTMFSRRVFELLACGTPIVSTISAGVEDMFGNDLVWMVKNEAEAKEAIHTLLNSPAEWRRRSLQGVRAVFARHTFAHRFHEVLSTVGIRDHGIAPKRVLLVAEVRTQAELNRVVETYNCQKLVNTKAWLLIVARAQGLAAVAANMALLHSDEPLSKHIQKESRRLQITHIAFITPTAIYGANYLQDILHAFDYSDAALVGKPSSGLDEYAYGDSLIQAGSILSAELLELSGFPASALDTGNLAAEVSRLGKKVFMSDAANFINSNVMLTDEQRSTELHRIEI